MGYLSREATEEATKLLKLLAFFSPDLTPKRLLTNTEVEIQDEQFEFLYDDFEYDDDRNSVRSLLPNSPFANELL